MSLFFFYTMVQKSQKWPKTQIKGGGGPALTRTQYVHPLRVGKWRVSQKGKKYKENKGKCEDDVQGRLKSGRQG